MTQTRIPAGVLLLVASLLQSCGGGGGASQPGASARLTVTTSNVSVASTPGEIAPESAVGLTVTDNPPDVVYYTIDHSSNGLDRVEFTQTGPSQGEMRLFFKPAGSLVNDTYDDSIEIRVCLDDLCHTDVKGSPKTIHTAYLVSGEGSTTGTISRNVIELTSDQRENSDRRETVTVTLNAVPPSGIRINPTHTSNAIDFVANGAPGPATDILIGFTPGSELGLGTYGDTVTVNVCYDDSCVRQIAGSPFEVATTLNVTLGVEPGLPQLQYLSQQPLGHDVVDAEYSAAMNAIVMIGSYPRNAIYVFDMDTGIESEQLLIRAATSLAISPDGLVASVGHDAFISVVDLASVGTAGAPAPAVLNVSIPVHDVALDGNGHVYAVPIYEQGDYIHAVDIASNTEQITEGFVERIWMQPGTQYLYGVPDSVPSDVRKWDASSGLPGYLYDWQYFSEHSACLNIWFSESGDRFYTACGGVFSASADPAQDMLHAGTMALTEPVAYDENYIQSLSHSSADDEIALIEWHFFDCRIGPLYRPCYTRLAFFDDDTYARKAIYGIGPLTTGGAGFAQRGRYVFHDSQSSRKYLISQLEEPPSEDQRFWISAIE